MRKIVWTLILALLLTTGAAAEGTTVITTVTPPPVTETQTVEDNNAMMGSGAVLCNDSVYMVLSNGDLRNLYRVPLNGESAPTLVDTAEEISDLVASNNDVYYLRKENGQSMVGARKADGTKSIVTTFNASDKAHSLSTYGNDLLIVVNDQLHIVYTGNGLCLKLVGAKMSEYVVVGDYAYYAALSDTIGYETASLKTEDGKLSRTAGCLYRLNLTTGNPSLLLKVGISDLKYQAGKLYFHNISDNYVMGAGDLEWMEGRLYAYDIATGTLTRVKDGYDWGFYPTQDGVLVYTSESLDFINPASVVITNQASEPLYKPEGYATLEGIKNGVAIYEPTYQRLVLVYSDGTSLTAYSGDLLASQAESTTVNSAAASLTTSEEGNANQTGGWFGTPKPTANSSNGSSANPAATPLPNAKATATANNNSGWNSSTTAKTTAKATTKATAKATAKATTKPSSGKDSSYIFPNSSAKKLTREDVLSIDRSLWGYARNEIYARHGYKFTKQIYKDYFAKKSWYKAGGFSTKDLNDIEWYNMDLIKAMEAEFSSGSSSSGSSSSSSSSSSGKKDSSYIFPNSGTKKLTREDVLSIDRSLWGYARNEIYARHGYTFTKQIYKDYFAKKSWYKAGGFSEKDLNDIEWYNMDLIKAMEKEFS